MLVDGLDAAGCELVGPVDPAETTGIATFTRRNGDTAVLYAELDRRGFRLSLRRGWDRQPCIRVAPHGYNTEAEIARLLGATGEAGSSAPRVNPGAAAAAAGGRR